MARIAFTAALAMCLGVAFQGTSAAAGVQDLEIGGRFLQDWIGWGSVDDALVDPEAPPEDATEVRSAYVSAKGKLATHLRFKADYDFAGGEVGVKDVYLEIFGIPGIGNARVGHWIVPVGLDQITSTKNLSFLEGGSCMALAPGRNSGLMLWNTFAGGRVTAELGAFKEVDDFAEGSGSGEGGGVAGRLTGLVMNADEGKKLLHVAVSGVQWDPRGEVQRFRARPELHLAGYLVDTGNMPTETGTTIGVELAGVFGPAHFQGEYMMATVGALGDTAEDASFSGYYIQGGYFLTGESRAYKGTSFDRTKTKSDFLDEGGLGAWEVVARYSSLDLNDEGAGVLGGKMDDVTVGLNWYMSSYARFMFDYVMATVSDADGEEVGKESALAARMQFDF
jgi:phosphate-selective porin OprO/OprP